MQEEQEKTDIPQWLEYADHLRLNLPEEQKQPWLTFLLDAYSIVDASVKDAIEESEKKGKSLACSMYCPHCCSQNVPISPVEAMGIRFMVHHLLPKAEREPLLAQLKEHNASIDWKDGQCPFLMDNLCSIHALRPIACRRYLVADRACEYKVEDVSLTRADDFIFTDKAALYAAYAHTSPVYASLGISDKGKVLTFDNFKDLFVDIRTVHWI